ncbi:MAG: STAS/SEC14 domain-containing protein [Myxococcales bacterium]
MQTSTGSTWIDRDLGILRFEFNQGSVCTLAGAKENVEAQLKLAKGERLAILVDIRKCKEIDHEARAYFGGLKDFQALALLGGSLVGNILGNFFLAVYGTRETPTKLFAREDEAIGWLKSLPSSVDARYR